MLSCGGTVHEKAVYTSYEAAISRIKKHEHEEGVRYVSYFTRGMRKPLAEVLKKPKKIYYRDRDIPFTGVPFIISSTAQMDCEFGPDINHSRRIKYREEQDKLSAESPRKRIKRPRDSKKSDCPAHISLREIIEFPQNKIKWGGEYMQKQGSKELRELFAKKADIAWQVKYILTLPHGNAHQNHPKNHVTKTWAVVTGAGTGIGAALSSKLAENCIHVLAIGRRLEPLEETALLSPKYIHTLQADITKEDDRKKILDFIPPKDVVRYLIHSAVVGVPEKIENIQISNFEEALSVNVTAPLFLTKGFLPRLKRKGRILHFGSGVAFQAQLGTTSYGISKMGHHRLYEQLKLELPRHGVKIANIMVGVVDTEGLWKQYDLASSAKLPHTTNFEAAKVDGNIKSAKECAERIKYVLLETGDEEFINDWSLNDDTMAQGMPDWI